MTLEEFLFTYRKGTVYTEKGDGVTDNWYLCENRKLVVPDYQREYRWEEKQLIELINDIGKDQCYLGQIAITQNSTLPQECHIIDGQQRVTSIIILYTVLVRQLYLHNDRLNVEKYDLHKSENNKGNPSSARLNFSTNCFSDFQKFISQIYDLDDNSFFEKEFSSPCEDDYYQKDRYIDACIIAHNDIAKRKGIIESAPKQLEFVREFLEKILRTKISVVVFESNKLYDGERVFLDINEKGLRLDDEDILKAYYFQIVPEQCGDEALKTWKALKKAYFNLKASIKKKLSLETFVSIALQTELLMENSSLEFSRFDSELRYKEQNGKKHICELFIPTRLHETMQLIVKLFEDLYQLSQQDSDSQFYTTYLSKRDSTTRNIFKFLYNPIYKSGMIIIYIALIKLWWLRTKNDEKLTPEDITQIFSFYIIGNISGVKKERILFDTDFIRSAGIKETYTLLHLVEKGILEDAASKTSTLITDQDRGEFLSFHIQMFYNDFGYSSSNNRWEVSIPNQTFLEKYNSNRKNFVKDHFIIQNGESIQLYNDKTFKITQRLKMLRRRAYNFIYHYDDFENVDFITRLEKIQKNKPEENYGQYERDYFEYITKQLRQYFDVDNKLSSDRAWKKVCQEYSKIVPSRFDSVVSYILEINIFAWNHRVCNNISSRYPR